MLKIQLVFQHLQIFACHALNLLGYRVIPLPKLRRVPRMNSIGSSLQVVSFCVYYSFEDVRPRKLNRMLGRGSTIRCGISTTALAPNQAQQVLIWIDLQINFVWDDLLLVVACPMNTAEEFRLLLWKIADVEIIFCHFINYWLTNNFILRLVLLIPA